MGWKMMINIHGLIQEILMGGGQGLAGALLPR